MLLIPRYSTDPYFNLAAEEYFLKAFGDDIFMLWQNDPCIVIGKHQNALAEINFDFVEKNSLPVIRRISGGGTVYHDRGNLNFTFIRNGEKEKLVDFRRYMQPVIDALQKLGLDARFEGRNDIRINGLKVSGNAEHVYKGRVLHHGTLLFSSELEVLENAITPERVEFQDKAVKSVRSVVANIADCLSVKMDISDFKNFLLNDISANFQNVVHYKLTEIDEYEINLLAENKYKTWKWNFGYSPAYTFYKSINTRSGEIAVELQVESGIITNTQITSQNILDFEIADIENALIGLPHNYREIGKVLKKLGL